MKFQAIAPVFTAAVLSNVQAAPVEASISAQHKNAHRAFGPILIGGVQSNGEALRCAHHKTDDGTILKKYELGSMIALKSQACDINQKEDRFWLVFPNGDDTSANTDIAIVNEKFLDLGNQKVKEWYHIHHKQHFVESVSSSSTQFEWSFLTTDDNKLLSSSDILGGYINDQPKLRIARTDDETKHWMFPHGPYGNNSANQFVAVDMDALKITMSDVENHTIIEDFYLDVSHVNYDVEYLYI